MFLILRSFAFPAATTHGLNDEIVMISGILCGNVCVRQHDCIATLSRRSRYQL